MTRRERMALVVFLIFLSAGIMAPGCQDRQEVIDGHMDMGGVTDDYTGQWQGFTAGATEFDGWTENIFGIQPSTGWAVITLTDGVGVDISGQWGVGMLPCWNGNNFVGYKSGNTIWGDSVTTNPWAQFHFEAVIYDIAGPGHALYHPDWPLQIMEGTLTSPPENQLCPSKRYHFWARLID